MLPFICRYTVKNFEGLPKAPKMTTMSSIGNLAKDPTSEISNGNLYPTPFSDHLMISSESHETAWFKDACG